MRREGAHMYFPCDDAPRPHFPLRKQLAILFHFLLFTFLLSECRPQQNTAFPLHRLRIACTFYILAEPDIIFHFSFFHFLTFLKYEHHDRRPGQANMRTLRAHHLQCFFQNRTCLTHMRPMMVPYFVWEQFHKGCWF